MIKKLLKIICGLLIAAFIFLFILLIKDHNKYTGLEWFNRNVYYYNSLCTYADNVDDVVTLYIGGGISQEDFHEHLSMLTSELDIMTAAYEQEAKEHPVISNKYSFDEKRGCEAIKELYGLYYEILEMLEKYSGDMEVMSYNYIAYQQKVAAPLSRFMTSYANLVEENSVIETEQSR